MPIGKHLKPLVHVWKNAPVYFITVCVQGRQKLVDDPAIAKILTDSWKSAPEFSGWLVGRYVIMPDHVHFFVASATLQKTLAEFLRDWKKFTSRQINLNRKQGGQFWQRETFDHLLRSPGSYQEKWNYVLANPVRAGLISEGESWAYQGEIFPLEVSS